MRTKGKAWKLKNKGFTLIEMIVTVAIIAIFSGVVVTFIGTGSGVYRSTSSNSKVQMETQETFDKIEDLIIDANRSLYYANGSGSEIGTEIRNDIKEKGGANSTGNKTFIACNEYENGDGSSQYIYDVLDWQASDGKIYYSRREYTAASSADTEDDQETETFSDESGENSISDGNRSTTSTKARNSKPLVERSVLATGILDFRADVSKVESDKIVRFQLSTENGKKQIQTLHSVSLRNNVDLEKPSDAFNKADATDVGIRIINAPESMDPGESAMLAYGLTGNGTIDPTTVTWLVVENDTNGSFPAQDHTNGRLTISENGSGYIMVKVTAMSTTGQLIESQVVKININAKATPISLSPDKEKILIAAGARCDLSSNISWGVLYSDGSSVSTGNLSWTINGCSYANISSSGILSINADAGTTDKGVVTVTVTDADYNDVYGTLEVDVARLDMTLPGNGAIYEVGNNKQLKCTYMEKGNVVETVEDNKTPQIITVTTEQRPDNASEYSADGNFTQNDIGTWTVKAAVDLSVRANQGYDLTVGTVSMMNTFKVDSRNSGTGQIIVHNNSAYDTVIAGRNYACSGHNSNDFYFSTAGTNVNTSNIQSITWSFKGEHPGITLDPVDATNRKLIIDKSACQGFTLCADYVGIIGYDNGKAITAQLYAERTFKVANGIELKSLSGDTAYVYGPDESEDYLIQVLLDVYDINGVKSQINVSDANDTILHWEGLGSKGAKMTFDGEHWKFHASATDVGKTQNIKAKLQRVKNVYDTKNNYYNDNDKDDNFIKTIPVKVVLTYNAEIVALNNKTSLFPGESTELYLRLKNSKGLLNAQVQWTVDNESAINFEYNTKYQESTYENGKEIPIKISADTKITEPTTVTLTANYKIKNVGATTGTKSIQLTITPLTMNLTASATQTYYGEKPIAITADIVDAQHDQHVTDDYDIEWSLNPENAELYTIGNVSGKETSLSVKKAPDSIRTVTVTATAKDKNSKTVICSSSVRITVSPKITIEKAYNCAASQVQKLEFNDSDKNKNVEKIKTSYMPAMVDALTECEKNQLPLLALNDADTSNLSITMNTDTSDYENYKYDLISVDMGDVLYNFYIYPLQNNVYDCEYGQDTGVVPYTYVPTDIESIRRLGVLGSNDDADKSYPGYTYTYTDALKESCYLRFSVYNKTGVGVISDNYVDSSAQKWFMKRKARNKNDGENYTYYRQYGNKWYKFHSLGKVKAADYDNNVLYNKEKANRTRYYWDLKDNIHLYDDNGKELEGKSPVDNIYFWQKWQ